MSEHAQLGQCKVCREQVIEPESRVVHKNARKATFVLMSGKQMDLTLCANCLDGGFSLSKLWKERIAASVHVSTNEYRRKRNQPELDPRAELLVGKEVLSMVNDPILGILAVREVPRG